jgi:carboxymethylenebutenolidase
MCHSDESRPPAASGAGGVASRSELVLVARDGNRFAACAARAGEPTGAGVVVMPDVRGLHEFYRDLAVRFAEVGIDAVAIDYFGRTAGIGDRSDAFDYMPYVQQTSPRDVAADVAAAAGHLRSPEGGGVRAVFTVGFCFGGGHSWRQSAETPGLAGAVGFYGRPNVAADVADRMSAPLLMLVAGADANIPVADVEALAERVRSTGTEVDLVVYDGAPHSFFDRRFAEHADACQDAWRRVREFVGTHAAG